MAQPQPCAPTAPAIDLDAAIPAVLAAAGTEAARLAPAICAAIAQNHVLTMRLAAAAKASFDRIAPGRPSQPAVWQASRRARRLAEASGQAMDSVRLGALALQRLDTIGRPRPHRRAARPPMPATASLPLERRGRLKNGNPAGDYLAAPRCGASTRCGGCCRQPAMANGRCRMHGGKSTGPRTAQGLSASRLARFTQGDRSAAARAVSAVTNAARSLARLQRVQLRVAPLLAEPPHLPSTPCPAETASAGDHGASIAGVGTTGRSPLQAHPFAQVGEGNAPHRNSPHAPSTPCQAETASAGDHGASIAGVGATGRSPLRAYPFAQVGEGNAPHRNSPHAPSTPCQAARPPRHSFPWPHRPVPPMVPRASSIT